MRILFVCTGNMCRSPMAAGLARAVIDRDYPEASGSFRFSSAGVAALEGNAPTREAVQVMMERGIDISGHRAVVVTRSVVQASDLVLTMEEAQRRFVTVTVERSGPPAFLLLELGEAAEKSLAGTTGAFPELLLIARGAEGEGAFMRDVSRYEVPDPIGMPPQEYRRVASVIEGPIANILRVLV